MKIKHKQKGPNFLCTAKTATRKSEMGKIIDKGRHTVKIGNHPHINMLSKAATMKRGEYRGRKWELHLKLKEQQLKQRQLSEWEKIFAN